MAVSYIDTCYLIVLIDPTDKMRSEAKIGRGRAESIVGNLRSLKVPLPAYSEAICKTGDYYQKDRDARLRLYEELDRLRSRGFVEVEYIKDPETLRLASEMARSRTDERDKMSIMDSLIIATATSDPECRTFYTTDDKCLHNSEVWELSREFRERHEFDNASISVQMLWKTRASA